MSAAGRWTKIWRSHKWRLVGVLALVFIVFWAYLMFRPLQRSAEAYCQVYKEERARLATLPGDTYPSGVFREELSDAGEIAKSYSRLARVAPTEIQKDVETLEESYKQIDSSSSNFLSAGFASITPNQAVISWTEKNCKE